jgi:hypothetical protein
MKILAVGVALFLLFFAPETGGLTAAAAIGILLYVFTGSTSIK